MPTVGDSAPQFTAPMADGEIHLRSLSDLLTDPPVLLAFFPGAFTGTCTSEMQVLDTRFADHPVQVVGISRDLPFALNAFRDAEDLTIPLFSDPDGELIEAYDVVDSFSDIGLTRIATRSVLLVDATGTITYRWVGDDPGTEPPYDDIQAALDELVS